MTKEEVITIGADLSIKVRNLTIGKEPIWSSNAGRSSTGKMVGDIIAWKVTLGVTFCPMTREQAYLLESKIHARRYNVSYIDPATNARRTITCYGVPYRFNVYNYVKGPTYSETPIDFVEE